MPLRESPSFKLETVGLGALKVILHRAQGNACGKIREYCFVDEESAVWFVELGVLLHFSFWISATMKPTFQLLKGGIIAVVFIFVVQTYVGDRSRLDSQGFPWCYGSGMYLNPEGMSSASFCVAEVHSSLPLIFGQRSMVPRVLCMPICRAASIVTATSKVVYPTSVVVVAV